jgi:hypothetical protein
MNLGSLLYREYENHELIIEVLRVLKLSGWGVSQRKSYALPT